MAYLVNKNIPVIEKFTETLIPFGDSVTVTFKTKANLSRYGIYNVSVYGTANNDDYIHNDTLAIKIENTDIDEPLVVFPNPFTDELNIVINTDTSGIARIRMLDLTGRTLIDEEHKIEWGENLINISGQVLNSAVYFIKIESPGIRKTIPVIKTNR